MVLRYVVLLIIGYFFLVPILRADETRQEQWESFLEEENERMKHIKLLDLDLKRADLQLKLKETEQKISQIPADQPEALQRNQDQVVGKKYKLMVLSVVNNEPHAVIQVNGQVKNVVQGQEIMKGDTVTLIDEHQVIIKDEQGQEIMLVWGQ